MQDEIAAISSAAAAVGSALSSVQIEQLAHYVDLVFKWNRIANLTGARSRSEFVTHHLADCLTLAPFIRGSRLLDVGSGAGLPGIVVACAIPALHVTMLEPRAKRARFLDQVRIELGLGNVAVAAMRIEDWKPTAPIDTFVCRAFGTLSEFVAATRAVQTLGCRLVAMKGRDPRAEIAALDSAIFRITLQRVTVPGWDSRHLVICERMVGSAH